VSVIFIQDGIISGFESTAEAEFPCCDSVGATAMPSAEDQRLTEFSVAAHAVAALHAAPAVRPTLEALDSAGQNKNPGRRLAVEGCDRRLKGVSWRSKSLAVWRVDSSRFGEFDHQLVAASQTTEAVHVTFVRCVPK
jgi:hypothetical protein